MKMYSFNVPNFFFFDHSFQGHGVESTIRKILEMYQQNTVEVEDHVWETLELQEQEEVTPDFINRSFFVQIKP